jgi:F-actin capping protein beta subunit
MTPSNPLVVVGIKTRCFSFPHIQTTDLCALFRATKSVYIRDCNANRRYFEGGVSSVFLWDLEDGGFAGVVLLKKSA